MKNTKTAALSHHITNIFYAKDWLSHEKVFKTKTKVTWSQKEYTCIAACQHTLVQ